jgi:hypothetical protein
VADVRRGERAPGLADPRVLEPGKAVRRRPEPAIGVRRVEEVVLGRSVVDGVEETGESDFCWSYGAWNAWSLIQWPTPVPAASATWAATVTPSHVSFRGAFDRRLSTMLVWILKLSVATSVPPRLIGWTDCTPSIVDVGPV